VDASSYTAVGRIVKTHGVAGELSVAETTSMSLEEIVGYNVWVVPPVRLARPYRVTGYRSGPKGPLLTLDGVDDIGYAREMAGSSICLASEDVPMDFADEPVDHVGYSVSDETRGDLGVIEELIVTGANDVWIVRGPYGEVLLPVIDDVVLAIDDDARTVSVRLLRGLLEDKS